MPRTDERHRRSLPDGYGGGSGPATAEPSKSQVKRDMHALQQLGLKLVALDGGRFAALAREAELSERLVDAVSAARSITAWGARKRQLQFIGKLMREVDPEPIRRRLDLWAHGHDVDAERQHALERWRERLMTEPDGVEALAAEFPRADRGRLRSLVERARVERGRGSPPRAYRELFRALKALATPAE
jgi:ribosome-associated protein